MVMDGRLINIFLTKPKGRPHMQRGGSRRRSCDKHHVSKVRVEARTSTSTHARPRAARGRWRARAGSIGHEHRTAVSRVFIYIEQSACVFVN